MAVQTVTGPIGVDDLGATLPHEHLFADLQNQFTEPADAELAALSREPVQMANLGALRRNPYLVRDNLVLDDLDTCVAELRRLERFGIRTIVDCTSSHRDPAKVREAAVRARLNVVVGCGYYTHDTHPLDMAAKTPERIASEMVRDLTEGIGGSGVRAGVMGEIGTSDPVHANEHKALLGAALAFEHVAAGIHVHTYPWARHATDIADLLIARGVEPSKIAINHLDVDPDVGYIRAILQRGVFVEFDCFGKEYPIDPGKKVFAPHRFPTDVERVDLLLQLIDEGFASQLFIANDLCFKIMLRKFGGWGYSHIPEHIVPTLLHRGADQETVDMLMVGNPARFLDVPGLL